ncbi:hypothetical protein AB0D30_20180 [Streptomyces sp. NPDC048409]|uniref:hypothetical protein n=1 Tax=Streptomyces sp. NPDC048409 TaxID=3154723 RepID=UPI00343DC47E
MVDVWSTPLTSYAQYICAHHRGGLGTMKAFIELLGKAMQSTGATLRLCLLISVSAGAYFVSQVK